LNGCGAENRNGGDLPERTLAKAERRGEVHVRCIIMKRKRTLKILKRR